VRSWPGVSRRECVCASSGGSRSHFWRRRRTQRPSGYSFLPELAACPCRQVSVETAQSRLDCEVLSKLGDKQIMVGAIDLSDMTVESPETVVNRVRRALKYVSPENVIIAPDCGMKYLPREVAFGKMRAMVEAASILGKEFGG
jgi:5-methyltetrahydropteroyltriglutamate--homocysteine methyltransferase